MDCGICENNATDCECTHHEQAAYEKGRSEAQSRIAELEAEVAELKEIVRILARSNMLLDKSLDVAIDDNDAVWNNAIAEAAKRSKEAWDSGYDATPHILALRR